MLNKSNLHLTLCSRVMESLGHKNHQQGTKIICSSSLVCYSAIQNRAIPQPLYSEIPKKDVISSERPLFNNIKKRIYCPPLKKNKNVLQVNNLQIVVIVFPFKRQLINWRGKWNTKKSLSHLLDIPISSINLKFTEKLWGAIGEERYILTFHSPRIPVMMSIYFKRHGIQLTNTLYNPIKKPLIISSPPTNWKTIHSKRIQPSTQIFD